MPFTHKVPGEPSEESSGKYNWPAVARARGLPVPLMAMDQADDSIDARIWGSETTVWRGTSWRRRQLTVYIAKHVIRAQLASFLELTCQMT